MNLKDYISEKRGRSVALARAIDVCQPDVSMWASGKRPIPVAYGAKIEIATDGLVTRQELFPDTWQEIWPELADAPKNRRSSVPVRERRKSDRRLSKGEQ
jgi:DNA-binding transcriptional regulator YdaS (Cro superfamily)